jgi:osmotically-inducible protein OsmY
MTDKFLRQEVLDELDYEPSVNSTNIGVAVASGVVTLTGHVSSYAEKIAAEAAVRRVRGVKAIAQEIEVRYPSDKKTADDQIAKRAVDILEWNAVVPKGAVQPTVRDGWITLTGQTEWQFQRAAAENAVRKLSGVAGVINNIAIKARAQPADIKLRIEKALKRNAEVEARDIGIYVLDGGAVKLEGAVHSLEERRMVESAVWSAPGVRTVDDRISIG